MLNDKNLNFSNAIYEGSFRLFFISVFVISTSLFNFPSVTKAESILQVLPTRVVMQDQKRSMTVTLINRGDEDGNYRLFFRNIRANEHGEFSEINEAIEGEFFADKIVRFSPRRITVPARSKQSIRVVVRKPPNLADGEYRSHLVFRKLPSQNSVLSENNEENKLGFSLRPIVEVTIPIIVRHGQLQANIALTDVAVKTTSDNTKTIKFSINRQGNRSIYGDVDAWLIDPDGERTNIGMARGIAVYTPNDKRIFELPLTLDEANTSSGKVILDFNEDAAYGGNLTTQHDINI